MSNYNLRTRGRPVDYSEAALAQRLQLPDHSIIEGLGGGLVYAVSGPAPKRKKNTKRAAAAKRAKESDASLNDLPDDCLLQIFSKLKGIREKLRLGRGNVRNNLRCCLV